ncbi:MAG: Asp-tRNA(Asn)/Glu-tRNA(Gln) amidotransferase subunit GatC [Gemmatimonadota bacterium]
MAVGPEEVRRIAALARLRPDEAMTDRLTAELNGILEHIRTLEEADVSSVEAAVRLPEEPVLFRDPSLTPDSLLGGAPASGAPDWRDGFFTVPKLPALDGNSGGGEGA